MIMMMMMIMSNRNLARITTIMATMSREGMVMVQIIVKNL